MTAVCAPQNLSVYVLSVSGPTLVVSADATSSGFITAAAAAATCTRAGFGRGSTRNAGQPSQWRVSSGSGSSSSSGAAAAAAAWVRYTCRGGRRTGRAHVSYIAQRTATQPHVPLTYCCVRRASGTGTGG